MRRWIFRVLYYTLLYRLEPCRLGVLAKRKLSSRLSFAEAYLAPKPIKEISLRRLNPALSIRVTDRHVQLLAEAGLQRACNMIRAGGGPQKCGKGLVRSTKRCNSGIARLLYEVWLSLIDILTCLIPCRHELHTSAGLEPGSFLLNGGTPPRAQHHRRAGAGVGGRVCSR